MDRILYVLIAGSVAAAIISAFFGESASGRLRISEVGLASAALFIWALACAAFVMMHTRWGRRMQWRFKKKQNDHDAEVRANARTKGEVRTPPLGPLP